MKERTTRKYRKKRKFYGNKHTLQEENNDVGIDANSEKVSNQPFSSSTSNATVQTSVQVGQEQGDIEEIPSTSHITQDERTLNISASESKLSNVTFDNTENTEEGISGYRLIDISVLNEVFGEVACPECFEKKLSLEEDTSYKKGFASNLFLNCYICGYKRTFNTSRKCAKGFDVNRRIVYSMRQCGVGYNGLQNWTTYMNMPSSICKTSYNKINVLLRDAAKTVAKNTMQKAAKDIHEKHRGATGGVVDIGVSVDASWQRRGYASLNGVTTAISIDTGMILDTHPQTKHCQSCVLKQSLKKKDQKTYDAWKNDHVCSINHVGSSGAMECSGAKVIFERSIQEHKLRYTEFYGDGDSKSHPTVIDTYPGISIKKQECIGHVQKRVGNRLRNLKKNVKNLGGKGKLTKAIIDKLQNYFGIAIRSNVGNLERMRNNVLASLFHVASSKDRSYHNAYCPSGTNSWCLAQKDKALGTKYYKPGSGLPLEIIKHVKPIYQDLSKPELLGKCLHGKTQNANESFHGMIWNRIPKTCHVGRNVFELGVYDAVSHFNIGSKAALEIFKEVGVSPGKYALKGSSLINMKRVSRGTYQAKPATRQHRKIKRGLKKSKQDKQEGVIYEAGGFT